MWIRSQNMETIGRFDVVEVDDNWDVVGYSHVVSDEVFVLGEYNRIAEALAVLDSIQSRIDSGNTQTFQMPKAGEPMGKHTHVYCTNCRYLQIGKEEVPFCEFQNYCDVGNPEDSVPLRDRPWFSAKAVSE